MVAVEDLRSELVWDRIAAVVGQLQVRGVLSVPVRLADQPVGTLDVYATQPRAWTPMEVEALGALAVVTAELVSTGVELANREVEVAQLRQALVSRVWIEQAKGVLAATQGISPDAAFQQLRKRAQVVLAQGGRPRPGGRPGRPSASGSRPWPSTTPGSGRLRRGPGRPSRPCRRPRPGWPDGPRPWTGPRTTPTRASGPPTERNHLADERDRAADERNHLADERERAADERNHLADQRERAADEPE